MTAVIEAPRPAQPADATHWSRRTRAVAHGRRRLARPRLWKPQQRNPPLSPPCKRRRDKHGVAQRAAVVGLALHPPGKSRVRCVDAPPPALARTPPKVPILPGRCRTMPHDSTRTGTTTRCATLRRRTGRGIGACRPRHRHQALRRFLNTIDATTPGDGTRHRSVDQDGTHQPPRVTAGRQRHPRVHRHGMPTSRACLTLVERWLRDITDHRLRHGVLTSVRREHPRGPHAEQDRHLSRSVKDTTLDIVVRIRRNPMTPVPVMWAMLRLT